MSRRVWALFGASVGVLALSGASAQTQGKPEGAKQSAGKNVILTGQKPKTGAPVPAISAENVTFFETKIRPLLAEKCYACHGDTVQQSGLRLNTQMGLRKGSSTGAVLIAGKPEESALIRSIHYDGAIKMPPTGKLSPSQIADLTEWVARRAFWPEAVSKEASSKDPAAKDASLNAGQSGAFPYPAARKNFWSFLPVKNAPLPAVKNRAWCKNPIDRFILAGLEAKGLKPAPAADRRTLIRRATFDMTGLPPTPEEVEAFAADKSPDAWAKVVDRLLASPRYGERWGRHWLDLVRYADSYDARGVGGDGDISEAWRYRDWVVSAFNSDMPYSQFMKYQVAGDLIPSAEKQGVIATGMLAIGNWGNGDADKDKIITDIADDQVDVISRSMMGLTVACARCHDHKFDPIPTKDYYGLAGMFFSSHILPHMASKGAGESPLHIPLITTAEQEQRALYVKQVAEGTARLQQERQAQLAAYALQMLPRTAMYVQSAWQYEHRPAEQSGQTLKTFAKEKNLQAWALRQWRDYLGLGDYPLMLQGSDKVAGFTGLSQWRGAADCPNMLINSSETPRTITTLTIPGHSVAVHPGPNNGVVVAWRSPITGTVRITGHVIDADPNGGDGIAWAVDHRSRTGVLEIASGDFPNGGKQDFVMGRNSANLQSVAVKQGDRLEFIVLPKENYSFDTTIIDATITESAPATANATLSKDNQPKENHVWNLTHDIIGDALQGGKGNPHADSYGNAAIWHFEDMADRHRGTPSPSASNNSSSGELAVWRQAVESSDGRMIDTETVRQASEGFARAFAERTIKVGPAASAKSPFHINSPADEVALPPAVRSSLEQQTAQLEALKKNAPPPVEMALGIQEGGIPDSPHAGIHDIKVHIRGSYARLGDMVPRHLPIILAGDKQTPITQGSGRLQLSDWLASDSHTLTPRVWVNRVWQHHFGQGIVRTPSNFGFLGERPTHPELLDWLAYHFVASRKTSLAANAPYAFDWSTKKLHRLLLLSATYQQSSEAQPATYQADPDNRLFGRMNRLRLEAEAVRDNLLATSGKLDTAMGGVAYRDFSVPRRTLYYMTIRSDRSGFGPLFDAADSTASMDHRTVSTVAPQSLYLLNNAFVIEQTRALALRLEKEIPDGPDSDTARIRRAYALLYGRPPSSEEIGIGLRYMQHMRLAKTGAQTIQQTDQKNAQQAAQQNTQAWEQYCQVLLCANEFIYVD